MKPHRLAWLWAALIASLASEAGAQPLGSPAVFDREHLAARFEALPESDLKVLYLSCSRESSQRLLDPGEAAFCSTAGEALKRRSFGGDFDALLAWWRAQRDSGPVADRR